MIKSFNCKYILHICVCCSINCIFIIIHSLRYLPCFCDVISSLLLTTNFGAQITETSIIEHYVQASSLKSSFNIFANSHSSDIFSLYYVHSLYWHKNVRCGPSKHASTLYALFCQLLLKSWQVLSVCGYPMCSILNALLKKRWNLLCTNIVASSDKLSWIGHVICLSLNSYLIDFLSYWSALNMKPACWYL